jgi:hypothetical protein
MKNVLVVTLMAGLTGLLGCGSDGADAVMPELRGEVGAQGLTLTGESGGALEGVRLSIAPGVLSEGAVVTVSLADERAALPEGALRIGPQVRIAATADMVLGPMDLELPFDESKVVEHDQDETMVKVWFLGPDKWSLIEPTGSRSNQVQLQVDSFAVYATGLKLSN